MTDLRIESHDESYPPSLWGGSTFASIAPTTAVVNVPTAYVLTGTGFTAGSVVKANGVVIPSTYVSPTRINVAAYSATATGTSQINVTTNGKVSASHPVLITATQAEPAAAPTLQPEAPTEEPPSFGAPIPVDELPGA